MLLCFEVHSNSMSHIKITIHGALSTAAIEIKLG